MLILFSISNFLAKFCLPNIVGFPGGSDGKEFACNIGDPGSIRSQKPPLKVLLYSFWYK